MTLRVHPDEIVAEGTSPLLVIHPSWERVRLGEIAVVQNGCAFPSSAFGPSGDMPLIRIRDVGKGTTATWYSGPFDAQYVVEPGSLIIGMDGEFRVEEWRGARALLNQRVCKVTVGEPRHYSTKFLRWVLPGYLDAVHRETSSVTVKHLSSETVKQLPLPLPPRADQDRIVAAIEEQFSLLDAGVAALTRVRQNLKRMRAAVAEAAVAGRLVPRIEDATASTALVEQLRTEAADAGSRKSKPVETVETVSHPTSWRLVSLRDLAESITYGTSAKTREDVHGIPVLRMVNLGWGTISYENLKYLPSDQLDTRLTLQPGDLLFNRTNSAELVGKTAVFKGYPERCCLCLVFDPCSASSVREP